MEPFSAGWGAGRPGSSSQNGVRAAPARALPDAFLRPYLGYSSLAHVENSATANYNGLQVGLNRRFSRGVLFGVAYTWSKNLGYAEFAAGVEYAF